MGWLGTAWGWNKLWSLQQLKTKQGCHGRFLAGKNAIEVAASPACHCCRRCFLLLKIQPRTKPWLLYLPWRPCKGMAVSLKSLTGPSFSSILIFKRLTTWKLCFTSIHIKRINWQKVCVSGIILPPYFRPFWTWLIFCHMFIWQFETHYYAIWYVCNCPVSSHWTLLCG